mmetsp:Transcript_166905/g.535775  ORF Transcript_166905/g.535775 Transcript_166905/m.535775 type:complete len:202 (-) Transcript_166905:563-1168(-)
MWRLAARLNRLLPSGMSSRRGGQPPLKALHAGCGTSALGAALTAQGWEVTNCDFCEEAVGLVAESESLGLLRPPGDLARHPRRRGGASEYAVGDVLRPPAAWAGKFDVVVEKGLADTLLFGEDMESALDRAVRYAHAVDEVLQPGGCLLQLSDAPLEMRLELCQALWPAPPDRRGRWEFACYATGAPPLSVLSAQKPASHA